jgi:hypothetical protein
VPQFGGEVMQRRPPTRSARRYRLAGPLRRWLSAAMPHPLSTMSIVSSSVTSIARTMVVAPEWRMLLLIASVMTASA